MLVIEFLLFLAILTSKTDDYIIEHRFLLVSIMCILQWVSVFAKSVLPYSICSCTLDVSFMSIGGTNRDVRLDGEVSHLALMAFSAVVNSGDRWVCVSICATL